jgi:hypothetical protein
MMLSSACWALHGQTVQLGGQTMGPVYDGPSQAVRQIVGIPGAAYLGPVVRGGVEKGSISPDGQWLARPRGEAWWLEAVPGAEAVKIAEGAGEARVAWSRDSQRVAVVVANQVYRGARREGIWNWEEPLAVSGVTGEVIAAGLEPGGAVWLGVRDEAGGGWFRWSGAAWERMGSTAAPGAWTHAGDRGYWADGGRLYEFSGESPGAARLLWETTGAIRGLELAAGGKLLLAVAGENPRLVLWQNGMVEREWSLDAPPTRVSRVSREQIYVLNGRSGPEDYLLIADLERTQAVYFVPEWKQ